MYVPFPAFSAVPRLTTPNSQQQANSTLMPVQLRQACSSFAVSSVSDLPGHQILLPSYIKPGLGHQAPPPHLIWEGNSGKCMNVGVN